MVNGCSFLFPSVSSCSFLFLPVRNQNASLSRPLDVHKCTSARLELSRKHPQFRKKLNAAFLKSCMGRCRWAQVTPTLPPTLKGSNRTNYAGSVPPSGRPGSIRPLGYTRFVHNAYFSARSAWSTLVRHPKQHGGSFGMSTVGSGCARFEGTNMTKIETRCHASWFYEHRNTRGMKSLQL